MSKIEILNFNKFNDIPVHIRRVVRQMHFKFNKYNDDDESHLDIAIRADLIEKCHVLMVDDVPVGWYAFFAFEQRRSEKEYEFGFWVTHKNRGKGYGKLLTVHSIKHYHRRKRHIAYYDMPHCWVRDVWREYNNNGRYGLLKIAKETLLGCSPNLCSVV